MDVGGWHSVRQPVVSRRALLLRKEKEKADKRHAAPAIGQAERDRDRQQRGGAAPSFGVRRRFAALLVETW